MMEQQIASKVKVTLCQRLAFWLCRHYNFHPLVVSLSEMQERVLMLCILHIWHLMLHLKTAI